MLRTFIDNRGALLSAIKESSIKENNKVKALQSLEELYKIQLAEKTISDLLFPVKQNINNGYALMSVNKVRQMILFFLGKMNMGYKTALNKLMFYADFLM